MYERSFPNLRTFAGVAEGGPQRCCSKNCWTARKNAREMMTRTPAGSRRSYNLTQSPSVRVCVSTYMF
ncbi:hypothetical protein J6590_004463 [Homalodisca vitripennis]|nr:hypothetical protein J6590_004463 [Homalodisca vitripennis]